MRFWQAVCGGGVRELGALALLGGLAGCGGGGGEPGGPRPNVLLVTLDTVRADALSCYGSPTPTPGLDAIAAAGARFDMALSASAVTPVSHASILTGRFPYGHGLRVLYAGSGFRLPQGQETVATAFGAAGYATGAVHSAFPVSGYFGFERGFDHFDSFEGAVRDEGGRVDWDVRSLQRRSDETTDRALAFVRGAERPWFLWIHYWDPHDNMLLPPEEYVANVPRNQQGQLHTDSLYAQEVRFQDAQIARLVDGLRALGVWDDTLVAVTADHGEGLSDGIALHGWAHHRILYQEQIRVPLMVAGPGVEAGRAVGAVVRTVDVAPTLFDYAGLEPPAGLDGASLRPLLEGRPDGPRLAYADQVNGYDTNARMVARRPQAAFLYSLVEEPWKLIWRPHRPDEVELYDLSSDPRERVNRAAEEPAVVRRLLTELARRGPWVTEPFPDQGGPDAGGALAALGYTGGDEDGGAYSWRWTCVEHRTVSEEARGRCATCELPLIPVVAQ